MTRPHVIFIGTRVEALQALHRYATVCSIVTVAESRVHQYCLSNEIPFKLVSRESREETFAYLASQPVKWILSAGFPFIIPPDILKKGAIFINSHPSLLPAYRGFNAIQEALEKGEEYMGVTVHYMVEEVDAGKVIRQESVQVRGLASQDVYDLLFAVVEPMAITKALETLFRNVN